MTPGLLIGRVNILFILIVVALLTMAILGIFKSDIYNRLSTRIIGLIFASSLGAVIITTALDAPLYNSQHPVRWQLLRTALIALGGPVLLGLLAARFVRKPLHQFNDAIASLEKNNYKVRLQPTSIQEFDEVFTKFNNLIDRLRQEEKLRKDLVSDTSHELNTPLTAMIGQLTAMQDGKYAMDKERVTALKQQAERLAELVQQLDTYTKARIPDTDEPEAIHLRHFCKKLIDQFSLELKQKGIQVKLQISDDYVIQANRRALQQIFTNLLQNTLRYSGATEISITATGHNLTFSDNGKGVSAESLPYLFERFYRVDTSRNRETGGLGLGLAIVKELAENQGWSITVKAGKPGLLFSFKVPPPTDI